MRPDLQFSVLCDDVRREDNGKFILIGLFEALGLPGFPFPYPSLCVINRWCNGEGKFQQRVRIMGPNNQIISEIPDSPVELPSTLANVTAVSVFRGVQIPSPGRYWIEVLLDGDLKQRYPLTVLQVSPQAPPPPPS